MLQRLYNLANDARELQLLERRSFLQLLELTQNSSIHHTKTIWLFRERVLQAGAGALVQEPLQSNKRDEGDTTVFDAPTRSKQRQQSDLCRSNYPGTERASTLKQAGWQVHIPRQGHATKGISAVQKRHNHRNRDAARPCRAYVRRAGADDRQVWESCAPPPHAAPQRGQP